MTNYSVNASKFKYTLRITYLLKCNSYSTIEAGRPQSRDDSRVASAACTTSFRLQPRGCRRAALVRLATIVGSYVNAMEDILKEEHKELLTVPKQLKRIENHLTLGKFSESSLDKTK